MMSKVRIAQKVEAVSAGSSMSTEKVVDYYGIWAKDGAYDHDMDALGFAGPSLTANYVASYFPNDRDDVFILDVAAGTGKVGQELIKHGFSQIDALDPCEAMLKTAKERDIYKDYICSVLDGSQLDIPESTYDVITCAGGIADGHLPAESIVEMLRLVKKGGVIILTGNAGVWRELPEYSEKMSAIIKNLEKGGKLTVLKEDIHKNYRFSTETYKTEGITIVIKKAAEY